MWLRKPSLHPKPEVRIERLAILVQLIHSLRVLYHLLQLTGFLFDDLQLLDSFPYFPLIPQIMVELISILLDKIVLVDPLR